jgi:PAS domain S-box-containing protein
MPDILRTIGEPSHVILHYAFIAPAWIIVHTENITDDERVERLIQRSEHELQEQIEERTIQLRQENTSLRRLLDQAKRTEDLLRTGDSVFREVLEAATDGILVCDSDGRIRIVNEQLANMFGYRRDELTDQPIEVLLPEQVRTRHIKLRDAYMSQPRVRLMETRNRLPAHRKDGSEFEVEISLSPVRSDRDLCVLCTVRKATALRPSDETSKRTTQHSCVDEPVLRVP